MLGGYGKLGAPHTLINALAKSEVKNLTLVCSMAASPEKASAIQGLLEQKKVACLYTSNVGENPVIMEQFKSGQLEVNLEPLGTLVEKARAGGFGVPAFYSPVGLGTFYDEGGVATKFAKDGKVVLSVNLSKEKRYFRGREYMLERAHLGDFAFVKAWKADTKGNCVLKQTTRNFNPDMATAGKVCIVEADEIVEAGKLDGDDIHIAGIFVHKVVKSVPQPQESYACCEESSCPMGTGETKKLREMMLKRAAKEIKLGAYVVMGAELSRAVEHYTPKELEVSFVCPETGVIGALSDCYEGKKEGLGELLNGSLHPMKLRHQAAIVKASDMFAAIRGKHMNLFILDGYQVSEQGDLANLEKDNRMLPSPGANMDLASAETPKIVLMEMTTDGKPNLVKNCTHRLSGKKCVSKLVTDMGVFEFKADGMTLIELAPGVTVEQVKSKTPCEFKVASTLGSMC